MTPSYHLDLAVFYACALALYGWVLAWTVSRAAASARRLLTTKCPHKPSSAAGH